MKYCVDCKWFKQSDSDTAAVRNDLSFGSCENPRNLIDNPLSPTLKNYEIKFAGIQRQNDAIEIGMWPFKRRIGREYCGKAGNWWEPKDADAMRRVDEGRQV